MDLSGLPACMYVFGILIQNALFMQALLNFYVLNLITNYTTGVLELQTVDTFKSAVKRHCICLMFSTNPLQY